MLLLENWIRRAESSRRELRPPLRGQRHAWQKPLPDLWARGSLYNRINRWLVSLSIVETFVFIEPQRVASYRFGEWPVEWISLAQEPLK
jgi:hypothetical protein